MKFTLSWLKEHLDTTVSLRDITDKLNSIGLEVDDVVNLADTLKDFKVAKIISAEKHPNADRLKVCSIDTGADVPVQIVCGGPNARAGINVVLASPGTEIPSNGMVIKKSKVRDVESLGMLCSASELGLGEDNGGIIELPDSAEIGGNVAQALNLNDPMIDIDITPNRPDCLGIRGIARDLAAAGLGTLKPLKDQQVNKSGQSPIRVKFDFPTESANACPLFVGCYIKGVKNGPSPDWLRNKLTSIGAKPISKLVDVTNYMTFDRARPLHVFDADRIYGDLTLRLSQGGEEFKALDEETYNLAKDDIIICDEKEIVSLAGVMGGLDSGCQDDTINVYVECALFDPIMITKTGRTHNIISDARFRFERGVDPVSTLSGMEKAIEMIVDLCGGTASELVFTGQEPTWQHQTTLRLSRFKKLTGFSLAPEQMITYLEALGFNVRQNDSSLICDVPSWRADITREEDIIEEIIRLHGIDNLPAVDLPVIDHTFHSPLSIRQIRSHATRRQMAKRGLKEAVTWSFISEKQAAVFGGLKEELKLLNPISQDLSHLRQSIVPTLLEGVHKNLNQGLGHANLFEVGPVYTSLADDGQALCLTGVRSGATCTDHWQKKAHNFDVYDVKADLLAALAECGVSADNVQIGTETPSWYHPGRSGVIRQGFKQIFGYFGELHPNVLKNLDIDVPVMAFELFISNIPEKQKPKKAKYEPSIYQPLERDFAFVVSQDIAAEQVLEAAQKADPKLITNVSLFDVYAGKGIPDDHKSLAIKINIQPIQATLTEEEITQISNKVIANVEKKTGGKLRG